MKLNARGCQLYHRSSLLLCPRAAATLFTMASPLAAQDDHVWTSKRPAGHAPIGIRGGRTLENGAIEFRYRFSQLNSKGVWLAND